MFVWPRSEQQGARPPRCCPRDLFAQKSDTLRPQLSGVDARDKKTHCVLTKSHKHWATRLREPDPGCCHRIPGFPPRQSIGCAFLCAGSVTFRSAGDRDSLVLHLSFSRFHRLNKPVRLCWFLSTMFEMWSGFGFGFSGILPLTIGLLFRFLYCYTVYLFIYLFSFWMVVCPPRDKLSRVCLNVLFDAQSNVAEVNHFKLHTSCNFFFFFKEYPLKAWLHLLRLHSWTTLHNLGTINRNVFSPDVHGIAFVRHNVNVKQIRFNTLYLYCSRS